MFSMSLRAACALLAAFFALSLPSVAHAEFAMDVQSAAPTTTQKAGHFTDFAIQANFPGSSTPKDIRVDLPGGALAVLKALSPCTEELVRADSCPSTALLGTMSAVVNAPILGNITAGGAIYVLPSLGTEVTRIGVIVRPPIGDKIALFGEIRLRTDGSFGARAELSGLPKQATLTIPFLGVIPLDVTVKAMTMTMLGQTQTSDPVGLFFNPSTCGSAATQIVATAWDGAEASGSASFTPTDCGTVPFAPALSFVPTRSAAATPTEFGVQLDQTFDPKADAIINPYTAGEVVLPDGVSLTAALNAKGDLSACTAEEFGLTTPEPITCPETSLVGDSFADSPLVPALSGRVYLGYPSPEHPDDLAELLVYVEDGPEVDALRIKFVIRISVDEATGLVHAVLDNIPQVPVSSFRFTFRAGEQPAVRQPRICGTTYGAGSMRAAGGGSPAPLRAPYVVDQNCDPVATEPVVSFMPQDTQAAGSTAVKVGMSFANGRAPAQELRVSMPAGIAAYLAEVPMCALADAASGTCPEASRVGDVRATSGQTAVPAAFTGGLYLVEAPDADSVGTLAVAIPVQVGPINIGVTTAIAPMRLRDDLGVDVNVQVPQTVRGVPLDLRDLELSINRQGFMRLPSACGPVSATVAVIGDQPSTSTASFTTTGCDLLPWAPSMSFAVGPTRELVQDGHPDLDVEMRPGAGGGAPRTLTTTMPAGIVIDLKRVNANTCPSVQSVADGSCTKTPVGAAEIATRIFAEPLRGSLYLATVPDRTLPAIVVHVRDRVRLDLVGRSKVDASQRIVVSFDGMPDAPMERVRLSMPGGSAGVLAGAADVCAAAGATGSASLTAHHGATVVITVPVQRTCGAQLTGAASALRGTLAVVRRGQRFGLDARISPGLSARRVVLTLPRGATIKRRRAVAVRGPGGVMKNAVVRVRGNIVTVVLPVGAERIGISVPVGGLKVRRSLAKALRRPATRAKVKAKGQAGATANAVTASGSLTVALRVR